MQNSDGKDRAVADVAAIAGAIEDAGGGRVKGDYAIDVAGVLI